MSILLGSTVVLFKAFLCGLFVSLLVFFITKFLVRIKPVPSIIICITFFFLYLFQFTLWFGALKTEEYIENLTHNLIIPFKLKKTIFYEVEIIEHIQPFEEVKDEKIEQARQKALIFLQENEIIINENYTIKEDIGCFVINYTITTNRNIGNT